MKKRDALILIEAIIKDNPKEKVHIVLKDRHFYNGEIINYEGEDGISFKDDKVGYLNILFSQIVNVELFEERGEDGFS